MTSRAADLARHAQRLEDPVGDRIGEGGLEPVEAGAEVARAAELVVERRERPAGGRGPELGERPDAVGQRHARPHRGDEVVDDVGPDRTVRRAPAVGAPAHDQGHQSPAQHPADRRQHGNAEDRVGEGPTDDSEHDRHDDDDGQRNPAEAGEGELVIDARTQRRDRSESIGATARAAATRRAATRVPAPLPEAMLMRRHRPARSPDRGPRRGISGAGPALRRWASARRRPLRR